MTNDKQLNLPERMTAAQPPTAVTLLADLSRWNQDTGPCREADLDLLSIVVEEALRGVDISKRFPGFWDRLIANAELRAAFLESLALLEESREGRLRPLPTP
jgi:hypothetical protein